MSIPSVPAGSPTPTPDPTPDPVESVLAQLRKAMGDTWATETPVSADESIAIMDAVRAVLDPAMAAENARLRSKLTDALARAHYAEDCLDILRRERDEAIEARDTAALAEVEAITRATTAEAERDQLGAALSWLVSLHDGPRNEQYQTEKRSAWRAARAALARATEQSLAEHEDDLPPGNWVSADFHYAEIANQQRAFELMLAEVREQRDEAVFDLQRLEGDLAVVQRGRDATEERYRQLADAVRELADQWEKDINFLSPVARAAYSTCVDQLRALAATAPQTAPAERSYSADLDSVAKNMSADVSPAAAPTPADQGPVRETAGERRVCSADGKDSCPARTPNCPPDCAKTEAEYELARQSLADADEALRRAAIKAGHSLVRDLNRQGWVLGSVRSALPARTASDEIETAARDACAERGISHDGPGGPVVALVGALDEEVAFHGRTKEHLKVTVEHLGEIVAEGEREIERVTADRDEARREAERLRAEVQRIAGKHQGCDCTCYVELRAALGSTPDTGSTP